MTEKISYYCYCLYIRLNSLHFITLSIHRVWYPITFSTRSHTIWLLNGYPRDQTPDFTVAPRCRGQWTDEASRDRVEEGDLGREGVAQEIAQQA